MNERNIMTKVKKDAKSINNKIRKHTFLLHIYFNSILPMMQIRIKPNEKVNSNVIIL